jgi:two-component system sensor histidine kinase QseC
LNSIKKFLIVSLFMSMACIMSIAGIYGYISSAHEIDEVFDAQLAQYTRLLSHYTSGNIASINADSILAKAGHKYESKISFQIWSDDKATLLASSGENEGALGPFVEGYHDVSDSKHQQWKVFVLYDDRSQRWYMAGELIEIRAELVRKISYVALFPLIFGTLCSMLLIHFILRKALQPLSGIAAAITQRDTSDLTPLHLEKVPDEVSALVANLNALLARVRTSLDRERRFSANAAHEIKTPLASLKLHLANLSASSGQMDASILNKAQLSCNVIQKLLEQLLVLNSLEPQYFLGSLQPVSLRPVCLDVLSTEAEFANQKSQDLQFDSMDDSLQLRSSVFLLQILLRNLVHNAILYTQPGGTISLSTSREHSNAVIEVVDNGPGIPVQDRACVLERFYRIGGDTHSSGADGSGLGLAIVTDIVNLHGGTISLLDGHSGSGLRVRVTLPL